MTIQQAIRKSPNFQKAIRKATALMVLQVVGANPNGDPDANGEPRVCDDGRGLISAVSLKRKLRDFFDIGNRPSKMSPEFAQLVEETGIDPERYYIFESKLRGFDTEDPIEAHNKIVAMAKEDPETVIDRCIDTVLFGTTMLEKKDEAEANAEAKKDGKKKGKKEDEGVGEVAAYRLTQTGPFSISNGFSVSPVDVVQGTMTRKAAFRREIIEKKAGDMAPGALNFVRHGLYVVHMAVCPHLADGVRNDAKDIEVAKRILPLMFTTSTSLTRPAGSIVPIHIWWYDHENPLGDFNEHKFRSVLTPRKKEDPETPSVSLDDYYVPGLADLEEAGLPTEGVQDLCDFHVGTLR